MPLKTIVQHIFHGAGGLQLVRRKNRARNRVLTYHNFQAAGVEAFEAQCVHIRKHYNPVSLDEVSAFVRGGKALPDNSIVLTVDDGYRDFYLYAFPVLRRHNIPATVFLMTNFLDGKEWPWWDRLRHAFFHTPKDSVELSFGRYELRNPESREAAYEKAVEALKSVPNEARLDFIARLPETFEVDLPVRPPAGLDPMSWDEVREMAAQGVSFGAHTMSHPILAAVGDEQLQVEIQGSRLRIQEELGHAPAHFCYPNGRRADVDERVRSAVERAGFTTAVSTEPGLNVSGSDPYMLKRLSMEPGVPTFYFRQQIAGFRL